MIHNKVKLTNFQIKLSYINMKKIPKLIALYVELSTKVDLYNYTNLHTKNNILFSKF